MKAATAHTNLCGHRIYDLVPVYLYTSLVGTFNGKQNGSPHVFFLLRICYIKDMSLVFFNVGYRFNQLVMDTV